MSKEKTKKAERMTHEAPADVRRSVEEEIRLEAYNRWQWRCEAHEPGSELDDWVAAEKLVHTRQATAAGQAATGPSR